MPTYASYNVLGSNISTNEIEDGAIKSDKLDEDFKQKAINKPIGENQIDIIELQADASVSPFDHDTLISETFTDADGFNNLVDTGSTTATHLTNFYQSPFVTGGGDNLTGIPAQNGTSTDLTYTLTTTIKGYIPRLLMQTTSAGDVTITIKDSGGELCATKTQNINGTAYFTFTLADYVKLIPVGNFSVQITCAVTFYTKSAITWSGTYLSVSNQTMQATTSTGASVDFTYGDYADGTIFVTLPTISGTITHTALIINGTTTGTYSLVEGANEDTGLIIGGTENAISSLTANPTTLKIEVPSGTYVKTFCLKLWKS